LRFLKIIIISISFTIFNGQIAFPTFQGAQKSHSSSATAENPLNGNMSSLTGNNPWNYVLGYRFTPQVNGTITQLGGYFYGTKTVRLWKVSDQSFLGKVDVTSNANWSYENLSSSVSVTAGEQYIVGADLNGSGGVYNPAWNGPHTYGNILVHATCYILNHHSDSYPNWQSTTYVAHMYGVSDITFIPD